MSWIVAGIISSALFAISNAVTKIFQPKLTMGIGLIFFALGVLVASIVTAIILKTSPGVSKSAQSAIPIAILAGFVWGFAQLFFLTMLSKNAPLTLGIPLVVGGITVGGVLAGILLFSEQITIMKLISTGIIILGVVLLARN